MQLNNSIPSLSFRGLRLYPKQYFSERAAKLAHNAVNPGEEVALFTTGESHCIVWGDDRQPFATDVLREVEKTGSAGQNAEQNAVQKVLNQTRWRDKIEIVLNP